MSIDHEAANRQAARETEQYLASLACRDPRVLTQRAVQTFLGCHFREVARPLPTESPLTTTPPLAQPKSTRVFVEGRWSDVEPHLARLAIAIPNVNRKSEDDPWIAPSVRSVSDAELIEHRFTRDSDAMPFRLWAPEPQLLIVQGQQRTSNAELPALLMETFELRAGKHTVLTHDPTITTWPKRVAYSRELDQWLRRNAMCCEIFPKEVL